MAVKRSMDNRDHVDSFARGLSALGKLHNLVERERGRSWCGHSLLGKRPDYSHTWSCRREHGLAGGTDDRWWDHTRGFGRGRMQLVIMGWPYGDPEETESHVRAYAETLGLRWHVGDPQGALSFYFYGATTPWAITNPEFDPETLFVSTSPDLDAALAMARQYSESRMDKQAMWAKRKASGVGDID